MSAEQAIKSIQKQVLHKFEVELLEIMQPNDFNALRKLVFRSTFLAYRIGFLGPNKDDKSVFKLIDFAVSAVMRDVDSPIASLDQDLQEEIVEYCLFVWLDAYRIGAINSVNK